jgi:hypothetical protein
MKLFAFGLMVTTNKPMELKFDIAIGHKLSTCSRILLEKLTATQVVKKFLAVYGTQRYITVFT